MTSDVNFRECHVIKQEDEEFEFFLRVDDVRKGQIITSLTSGGPADRAGVRDGDRVVEINGDNVEDKNHNQIVELIRQCIPTHEIKFKLVAQDDDPNTPKKKTNGSITAPVDIQDLRPRICKIKKKRNTFGFFLQAHGKDKPGHFIKEVVEGGPAAESGLREGDRIIEVSGTNVMKFSHDKVVNAIKKSGNKVVLLVVDEPTYHHYEVKKIKIKAKHAYSSSDSVVSSSRSQSRSSNAHSPSMKSVSSISQSDKARIVHMVKADGKGYGFFLRVKKGEPGEYVGDVEKGQAADLCSLKDDDRILAINGHMIMGKSHEEVIELMKSIPSHVVLVLIGPAAEKNACENGISAVVDGAVQSFLEKPRDVNLVKSSSGYGFYLKLEHGSPLHIITDVESDSPAHNVGLKDGDILINVNGNDVLKLEHEGCVQKIKDSGEKVTLTVSSKETVDIFAKLGIEVSEEFVKNWPEESNFLIPILNEIEKKKEKVLEVVKEKEEPTVDYKPRLCKLVKDEGGFGFFLKDDDGHVLGHIEQGGSAEKAGVQESDQIIEVNGVNVQSDTHDQVVDKIRKSGDHVTFLVVNKEEREYFKKSGIAITAALLTVAAVSSSVSEEETPLPRLCKIVKQSDGFGFHLNGESGDRPGQYIRRLMNDGAAEKGGLLNGDRVVEVNGTNISHKSHDDVVKMIVASGSEITFLVVDEKADVYYKKKEIEITTKLLVVAAVLEANDETKSSTSSLVEAAASVHAEADDEKHLDPPVIDFPGPPEDEVRDEIADEIRDEIADEIRDEIADAVEDKIEDQLEEQREEALEELAAAAAVAVVADEFQEDLKEEVAEEIRDEIRDEIEDRVEDKIEDAIEDAIEEAIKEEVKEDMRHDLAEDLKEEIRENMVDDVIDVREEVKDEIRDEIREEVAEAIVEDIVDEYREDRKEDIIDELKEEIREELVEDIKEELVEETKEDLEARLREEVKAQLEQERREQMEEEERMREEERKREEERLREEMEERRKAEEKAEMEAKIKEELRKEVEREMKLEAAARLKESLEEPALPPPPVEVVAQEPINNADIVKAAAALHTVRRFNDPAPAQNSIRPGGQNTFKNAMSRFQQDGASTKPIWAKNISTKKPAEVNKPTANGNAKPRQTSWSGNGMSLNIVETSSVFD